MKRVIFKYRSGVGALVQRPRATTHSGDGASSFICREDTWRPSAARRGAFNQSFIFREINGMEPRTWSGCWERRRVRSRRRLAHPSDWNDLEGEGRKSRDPAEDGRDGGWKGHQDPLFLQETSFPLKVSGIQRRKKKKSLKMEDIGVI